MVFLVLYFFDLGFFHSHTDLFSFDTGYSYTDSSRFDTEPSHFDTEASRFDTEPSHFDTHNFLFSGRHFRESGNLSLTNIFNIFQKNFYLVLAVFFGLFEFYKRQLYTKNRTQIKSWLNAE